MARRKIGHDRLRRPEVGRQDAGIERPWIQRVARPKPRLWDYARGISDSPTDDAFHEETTDPLVADARNFYKVEKWTRDGTQVDSLLYAANSLGREYSSVRSSTDRGST